MLPAASHSRQKRPLPAYQSVMKSRIVAARRHRRLGDRAVFSSISQVSQANISAVRYFTLGVSAESDG